NYDATVRAVGETVFLVVGYETVFNATTPLANDDNVRLWINPPASSFGAQAPTTTETVHVLAVDTDIPSFAGSLTFAQRSAALPTIVLDDLRMGTNWS